MTSATEPTYLGKLNLLLRGGKMKPYICAMILTPLVSGLVVVAAPPADSLVTLAPAANSPLPINAYAVAIADVNGDRHQDLIVTADHLQILL